VPTTTSPLFIQKTIRNFTTHQTTFLCTKCPPPSPNSLNPPTYSLTHPLPPKKLLQQPTTTTTTKTKFNGKNGTLAKQSRRGET
jgi:hypothetical protein